jgi:signal transduction histidine kinase
MPGAEQQPQAYEHERASGVSEDYLTVLKPHVKRGLVMCLLWSLVLGLFLRGLELIILSDARSHLGLFANVVATLIITFCAQALILAGWAVLGQLFWRRSQAARDRCTRDGVYAIAPASIGWLWGVVATFMGTSMGYSLWIELAQCASIDLPAHYREVGLRMSLLLATFSALVLGCIDFLLVRAGVERSRMAVVQRQVAQAQLHRLQAQMEPHMLFNTLANLHALIDTRPKRAQDMLTHLIDYLRATLTASRAHAISLRDEMAQVQDYLHLMQVRMGERLRVAIDVPDDLGGTRIPPMLIQPLVENAIKHGLDPMPDGGHLRVSVRRREGLIEIVVADDGQGLAHSHLTGSQPGFGLGCIRDRLQTCYGGAARFTLESPGQHSRGAIATLLIPSALPN